jgi:hypothetical protein
MIFSSLINSNASKSAAKTQSQATDRAAELQNQQFQQLLELSRPAYDRGEQAAGVYQTALGIPSMTGGVTQQGIYDQVRMTPGYQAQLEAGTKAIDRAAPLAGGMYSGRRMKALQDYGQNTFGSYYQDWQNRVAGIAGQGQSAGQNIGQAGMNYANNAGGLMVQGANARAQGTMNSANAWSGAIGTGVGLYGGSQGWFGR